MKRVLILLMIIAASFAFAGCTSEDSSGGQQEAVPAEAGTLGNYDVAIKDCQLVKDYDDNDAIAISVDFTNNGDEAVSFDVAMMWDVFQDGVELETAYVYTDEDSMDCLNDDTSRQIKPGKTIEVVITNELENTESPVDVEIEEFFGNGDKLAKTFDITQ